MYPALSDWEDLVVSVPVEALSSQTRFRWRQRAHSGSGFDVWALDNVCVSVQLPPQPTAPPLVLTSANSSRRVAVLWVGVSDVDHYVVERTEPEAGWIVLGQTDGATTYFTDLTAMPSTSYFYRVRAVK